MIKLDDFVSAIQDAVVAAHEQVMDHHQGVIDRYFEPEGADRRYDDVLQILREEMAKRSESGDSEELAAELYAGVEEALGRKAGGREQGGALRPKLVALSIPRRTSEGIEMKQMQVPLITLVPIQMPAIEEFKITTDIAMEVVKGDVNVTFSSPAREPSPQAREVASTGEEPGGTGNRGRLEITIRPTTPSEGMRTVISVYEKTLRSQMSS